MGLHAVVLAGGSGTRLWPMSRPGVPKHLLPLGPGGKTLLYATVERTLPVADTLHVVTTADQADACRQALAGLVTDPEVIIAEPMARGTGPALTLAVEWIHRADPEAVVVSVHADHHIGDIGAYQDALVAAAGWAHETRGFVAVGLTPSYPSTGFGYVEKGARRIRSGPLPSINGRASAGIQGRAGDIFAFVGERFIEKPNLELATAYLTNGTHVWNTGLFSWRADVFLHEAEAADGTLMASVRSVVDARRSGDEAAAERIYAGITPVAVEPFLLEGASILTIVEAGFSWSDVGSWPDLWAAESSGADEFGNVTRGQVVVKETEGSLVYADGGRPVAVIGGKRLIVVDTGDAVLVSDMDHAQLVREVPGALAGNS